MQIKEIAKKLNEQIIEEMQKGVVPWVCPWNKGFANGKTVAVNGVSKRAYRSCNYFFMNYLANQYGENEFFTFSQIMKLGGKLKKDARGALVVEKFQTKYTVEQQQDDGVVEVEKIRHGMKCELVYNRVEIDGLPPVKSKKIDFKPLENFQKVEQAEKVIAEYSTKPKILHEGRQAAYYPGEDVVRMPAKNLFRNELSYYSTLFHELIHSTGHSKRLNREGGKKFGDVKYSQEELVAELGASYLRALCGIETTSEFQQSASYLNGWLNALKKDETLFFEAANKAVAAVEYMLNKVETA